MRFFWRREKELSRREIVARRQVDNVMSHESTTGQYRRNKTLVSHGGAAQEGSDRQALRTLRQKRQRLTRWFIGVTVAAGAVLVLVLQLIVTVNIQTASVISDEQQEVYAVLLDEYFSDRPLERLHFALDEGALKTFFLENVSEVKSVQLTKSSDVLAGNLQMAFRQPVAQWSTDAGTFFVDEAGVVFENNYFSEPSIIVNDQSGIEAVAGQEIVNRRFLSFLGQVVSAFHQHDMEVSEVILPDGAVRQVEFRFADRSSIVRMTVDRTAQAQVDEAISALRFVDEQGVAPEYIDVRVNQRVFYK